MKEIFIVFLAFGSMSAHADSQYNCKNMIDTKGFIQLRVKKSFFGHELKKITITDVTETNLNIKGIEAVDHNLLSTLSNDDFVRLPKEEVKYANNLQYSLILDGGLFRAIDYYYLSNELLSHKAEGVLMIRDDYSCGPIPKTCTINDFYICTLKD